MKAGFDFGLLPYTNSSAAPIFICSLLPLHLDNLVLTSAFNCDPIPIPPFISPRTLTHMIINYTQILLSPTYTWGDIGGKLTSTPAPLWVMEETKAPRGNPHSQRTYKLRTYSGRNQDCTMTAAAHNPFIKEFLPSILPACILYSFVQSLLRIYSPDHVFG